MEGGGGGKGEEEGEGGDLVEAKVWVRMRVEVGGWEQNQSRELSGVWGVYPNGGLRSGR